MKRLLRAAAIPLLFLSACAGTQSALDAVPPPVAIPPSMPAPPLPPSPHSSTLPASTAATPMSYRVVVSFNSLAAGTDPATEARFLELVAQFEREVGHPLPWSRGPWGHEGEYDACLHLADVGPAQQADFVRQLRAALEAGGRASVREYSHCGSQPTR